MHPIASWRRVAGLTQADLAKLLHVSVQTVQRWEAGALPRARQVPKLAEALGVGASELDRAIREWKAAKIEADETANLGRTPRG